MRLIGYIRVSTDQQDLGPEVQRQGIERAAVGRELIIFEDRIGGGLDVEKREGLADALLSITMVLITLTKSAASGLLLVPLYTLT